MDYKELIERLKYYGTTYAIGENLGREIDGTEEVMADAATAIETLLAERDAAVSMLHGECRACKHNAGWHNVGKCTTCKHETDGPLLPKDQRGDNWEWRSPKKGDAK